MKRAAVLGLAITLTLGLGVAATQAKPKKVKVDTEVTLEDTRGRDWTGQVISEKPKCERRRRVALTHVEKGGPTPKGKTRSDREGDWEIIVEGKRPPGDYEITVDRRKIKKRRNGELKKIIVCRPTVLQFEFSPF